MNLAVQSWESCIYTAEEERDFEKFSRAYLVKAGYGNKKIIVWDHNRDLLFERANIILNDSRSGKVCMGTGFHWYEDWKGWNAYVYKVHQVNEAYPDKTEILRKDAMYDRKRIDNQDPKLAGDMENQ
jgi:glucosylceramidase